MRDFVSELKAERLLEAIDASDWRADLKRRVQHYGWRYDYRKRHIRPTCGSARCLIG